MNEEKKDAVDKTKEESKKPSTANNSKMKEVQTAPVCIKLEYASEESRKEPVKRNKD